MATYKFELNSKPNKEGLHNVMLRVTENRKLQRIKTDVNIKKSDFNNAADYGKWVRKTNARHTVLNNILLDVINEAQKAKSNLISKKQSTTAKNIIKEVKQKSTSSFTSYYTNKLEQIKHTHSVSYYRHLKSKLNNLIAYQSDILFDEINVSFLNAYEAYLKSRGLNDNSVISNLRAVRTILYEAIKEDIYQGKNPFVVKKLREIRANKTRLTKQDIITLHNLILEPNSTLFHVRNYFLFSFYCAGMRVADVIQLQWKNIKANRLIYNRQKTQDTFSIDLNEKALAILSYYLPTKPKRGNSFVFPILNDALTNTDKNILDEQVQSKTALINRTLKDLADLADIDINLTFHIARHSYADIVRTSGASIYDIKNLLGHADIKITERYLEQFDKEASNSIHQKALDF